MVIELLVISKFLLTHTQNLIGHKDTHNSLSYAIFKLFTVHIINVNKILTFNSLL